MLRYLLLMLIIGLTGCAAKPQSSELSAKELQSTLYRLQVAYPPAEFTSCEDLGAVAGESYDDMLEAKEDAKLQAAQMGATHLLLNSLWSERFFYKSMPRNELLHADGNAYRCQE